MSLTAAAGLISLPESYLAATIANCARWQTMCDVEDATEALAHIYFDALPPPANGEVGYAREELEALRPFAILYSDEDTGVSFTHTATSTTMQFQGSGRLKVDLEANVPAELAHDPQEVFRRFKNDIGLVMHEMLEQAGVAGRLAIRTLGMQGPLRAHEDVVRDEGDFIVCRLAIEWGRA